MSVIIYTLHKSSRLQYAAGVVLNSILKLEYKITSDKGVFADSNLTKINYSSDDQLGGLHVLPSGLLEERGIGNHLITAGKWDDLPAFFMTKEELTIPFDVFSAVFYLVARYEEYLPHVRDKLGRFDPDHSIAAQNDFLEIPVVDHWAIKLGRALQQVNPDLQIQKRNYQFVSTFDIDSAYAYIHKGFMRTLGGIAKDIKSLDFANLRERLICVARKKPDPFDTYDELLLLHREKNVSSVFFFLLADYGLNDKNVPHTNQGFRELIKHISDYHPTGIHPGFVSNFRHAKLEVEVRRLNQIINKDVNKSRQHFLMLDLPESYRRLIQAGVMEDYTMGFAQKPGFRLGTCTAVPFYDLVAEDITTLTLHPFTVMDATLNMYMKLSPDDALAVCKRLNENVRKVGGTFLTLWHNESLSEKWHWEGWKKVYLKMVRFASEYP